MCDLLKNIKTLFFSYMSVTVLLFFAVLQSSQQKYDSALQQLHEIEKLAASYDPNAIVNLIKQKAPETEAQVNRTFHIDTIDTLVSITCRAANLDYTKLEGTYEKKLTGFDFGSRSRDRFPPDFTDVMSIKTFLLSLLPPKNLADYATAHDRTLNDVTIPLLSPDFSKARIEAYQYRKKSHNSIVVVDTTEYSGHAVFDLLPLKTTTDSAQNITTLRVMKTRHNDRYVYLGDMPGFTHDGTEYSGARLLIPARDTPLVIRKYEMMGLYGIPEDKRLPFDKSYRELSSTTEAYDDLGFTKIQTILESEKSRNPSKLSIFGADINVSLLTKVAFPILLLMCLYMYLHLHEAKTRAKLSTATDCDVPWVGIYPNTANRYAVMMQLLLFPLILMLVIHWKSGGGIETVAGWLFCASLLVVNYFNFKNVDTLRMVLHSKRVNRGAESGEN